MQSRSLSVTLVRDGYRIGIGKGRTSVGVTSILAVCPTLPGKLAKSGLARAIKQTRP
jgi:hypothetical protein